MDNLKKIRFAQAIKSERGANKETWKSCLWCWQVFNNGGDMDVKGLADDMGKSDDTVYARAHAYQIFVELCNFDGGRHRFFVHSVRRLPWVYWSHFRELWDLKRDFGLTTENLFDLLMELYQSEGLSVRKMEDVVRGKLGRERTWDYYGRKVLEELDKLIRQPETPKSVMASARSTKKKLENSIKNKKLF